MGPRELPKKKHSLWTSSVRGGGVRPIHNFEAHFCASKVMEFWMKIEGFGYFLALFLKKIILNIAILGVLGKFIFFSRF